jgi:hypothetical protein
VLEVPPPVLAVPPPVPAVAPPVALVPPDVEPPVPPDVEPPVPAEPVGAGVPELGTEVPPEAPVAAVGAACEEAGAGAFPLIVDVGVVVDVEEGVVVDGAEALATVPVGTVRLGAPAALLVFVFVPPPQAARATARTRPATSAAKMAIGRLITG